MNAVNPLFTEGLHTIIPEFNHTTIYELLAKNDAVVYPVSYNSIGEIQENIPNHLLDAVIQYGESSEYFGITYTYTIRKRMIESGLINANNSYIV